MIMADPSASKYHIQGLNQICPKVLQMMVLVGCASRPAENFPALVLKDDRLPKMLPQIEAQMAEDIKFVETIPTTIFRAFSSICEVQPSLLRSECLQMLEVQVGYLQARLREVRRPPWNLICDDIGAKLESLAMADEPQEETTKKIWKLVKMGYPRVVLAEGIKLLGECPWTT